MRGRWGVLAGLFVVVPIIEIYFLIQVGQVIGPWWTIALLVADGVLGSLLVKREGARAWRALTTTLGAGRPPHRELGDAALVLVGGTLLLTPGFVTDIAGLFCVLPVTRPLARRVLARLASRGVQRSWARRPGGQGYPSPRDPQDPDKPPVVPGEVVD